MPGPGQDWAAAASARGVLLFRAVIARGFRVLFCLRPVKGCGRMCGDETTSSVVVGREIFVGKEVESER
jgi:hypothetical protein